MSKISSKIAVIAQRAKIILALMLREAVSKHGHDGLGFFWLMGEPLFLMAGIMLLWSFAHVTHGSEIDVLPFALSAYSYLTLWRHIAGASVRIIHRNRGLLFFRQIIMLDVLVAKAVLETLALLTTFTIVYIPFLLLGLSPLVHDPLLLVGGFFFTGWFSFSFGLLMAAITEISETFVNLVGAVMYITLPITGAFTMQAWLPPSARAIMAWSPLVNCVEMLRGGLFSPDKITVYYDFRYLISCCFVMTSIGMLIFRYAEKNSKV